MKITRWLSIKGIKRPVLKELRRHFLSFVAVLLILSQSGLTNLSVAAAGNWMPVSSPTNQDLIGVSYQNGLYIAVGVNEIVTSSDGLNWSPHSLGNNILNRSAYLGGKWWIVGDGGVIYSSPDGNQWTLASTPTTTSLLGISYDGTTYVVVGYNGLVLTSTDGASWTQRPSSNTDLYNVTYGSGKFVAVGINGSIYTSTNGITWITSYTGAYDFYSVTYWNGLFVAVGTQGIYTSYDGVTWQNNMQSSLPLFGVTYDAGTFFAVGVNGLIYSSKDGNTWTPEASNTLVDFYDVAAGGGTAVAVGSSGAIYVKTTSSNTNASLSNLTLSQGTLSPSFAASTTSYTASVANNVSSLTVTPTLADATATLKVNGSSAASGNGQTIPLNIGSNTITLTVTAQDGITTKTYTITVTRAASSNADLSNLTLSQGTLSPSFAAGTTAYTASVAYNVSNLDITPTLADATAYVTVNGTTIASGNGHNVTLSVGSNTILLTVTAQDGSTTKTYTITVTRAPASSNADLSNLTLSQGTLSPSFAAGTTAYTASVAYNVSDLMVTPTVADATATVTVNGSSVTSGIGQPIPLNIGSNSITLTVMAEDGTNKTYTITVTRAASSNADLSNLTLSQGTLSPSFAANKTTYTASVANNVSSLTVIPTLADATATLKVNGTNVASGNGQPIPLNVGSNTITLTVTAQDGSTKIYTILVKRNTLPSAEDTTLTIDENATNGTTVGALTANDLDGDPLHYSIISGNSNAAFAINAMTGVITVANGSLLDYETTTSYTLNITVSDGVDQTTATVKININNLNDNRPVATGFSTSIKENSPNGMEIGTVTATDADLGSQFSYKIKAGNQSGAFAIDENTGVVSVANSSELDFETIQGFTLTIQVSDGTNTADTTVTIDLLNQNDNAPTLQTAIFTVDENSPNGTVIGTVKGTDADGDLLYYSIIAGNELGAFAIDPVTGVITVADSSQLDFETQPVYTLTVQASDSHNTMGLLSPYDLLTNLTTGHVVTSPVTINIQNVNDNRPVPNGFTKTINENTANGTPVGTVTATDADANSHLTYQITAGNEAGAFTIDSNSGEIIVADSTKLDYETVHGFTLTVEVSDGTYTADTTAVIHLNNLNDNAPIVEQAKFSIDENAENGTTVGTVMAQDADGDFLTYSLANNTPFAINSTTGVITVANSSELDYETTKSFTLTVHTFDGTFTSDTTVTINILNLNDNSPVANHEVFSVDENATNGTEVGTVSSSDADGNSLTYSMVGDNPFEIDASSGKITVSQAQQLDYETVKSFLLTIQVSDGVHTVNNLVTINLNNVNDNSPMAEEAIFSLNENAANGTSVGRVSANDADGDTLSYTISENSPFVIDANGKMTVADSSQLDYETVKSFTLSVQVNDGLHTTVAKIIVNLNNVNDNPPTLKATTFVVDENAENGTQVGTVEGSDADKDSLTYSMVDTSSPFAIDSNTGEITVVDSTKLDFETTPSFDVTVEVSDGTYRTNSTVTINVNNLNDNKPTVEPQSFTVEENAQNGTEIGVVHGSDIDGNTLSYKIVGESPFAINASSGKMTVADSSQLDYETKKSYTITVQVSDGLFSNVTSVTINVHNMNDNAPVGEDATFTVDERATNGTTVGTVKAFDADGDEITYTIYSGNDEGIFTINERTGEITLANASLLDAEKDLFTLLVNLNDGQHTTTKKVTIQVLSSDTTLSNLTTNVGNFLTSFDSGTTEYRMNVGNRVESIKLTPTLTNSNGTVTINGKPVVNGQESDPISLSEGKNTITVEVTAQNGLTATYTVKVARLLPMVSAAPDIVNGSVQVKDDDVNLVDEKGTFIVDLTNGLDNMDSVYFTPQQLETLINNQAMIKVVKSDVQLKIPALNFAKEDGITINLVRVDKDSKQLPLSNLALGTVYDFTIKQGDKIIHHFDHEIELSFPAKGSNGNKLKVYYWNQDTNKWELIGGKYEDGSIKTMTNHFSTYALFQPTDLAKKPNSSATEIEKQTELPDTASDLYNWILAGILVFILGGAMLLIQWFRQKNERTN